MEQVTDSEAMSKLKHGLLRQRIYSALAVIAEGPDCGQAWMLCEPFNPGNESNVTHLALRVVSSLLSLLLQSLPEDQVNQLIQDIEEEVTRQGTRNLGRERREQINVATFGPLQDHVPDKRD
ncbi:MAG: hypothetical protein LRY38_01515 [Aeromonadaceae bacterium]|nr:hypothetical protein [Aeromonadaceae bacterium]